jgi:hypothetical protein
MHLKYGPAGVLVGNEPEQCGKIIKYLTHALEIAEEIEDGSTAYLIERAFDEVRS